MKHALAWKIIQMLSASLLLLRLIDFIDEAIRMDFHMTRIGVNIHGNNAMLIQLFIIILILFGLYASKQKLSPQNK